LTEKVKVEIELPEKIYNALEWYVRNTKYWVFNDHKDKSISQFCEYCVKWVLEAEANDPQMAYNFVRNELSEQLDLEVR
jgi:hypothetical protein